MTAQLTPDQSPHLRPDLGSSVDDYARGRLDANGFTAAFLARTSYGVRVAGRPMLAAYRTDGGLAAPVFSTLAALARWCAADPDGVPPAGVDWFAATGADLVASWPAGCDLVVDPGTARSVRYPASALAAPSPVPLGGPTSGRR